MCKGGEEIVWTVGEITSSSLRNETFYTTFDELEGDISLDDQLPH